MRAVAIVLAIMGVASVWLAPTWYFVIMGVVVAFIMDAMIIPAFSPEVTAKKSEAEQGISIIVPTYKEAANLKELCTKVHEACKAAMIAHEIIIVDDNSNDGSVKIIKALKKKGLPVRIKVRENEKGLSSAVMAGFKEGRFDVLQCMDADLSHPPEKVPEMYKQISSGNYDFVLGSRYISGGRSEHTPFRWMISKGATMLAKPLVPAISDPMSGFFAMPSSVVLATKNVNTKGFKIALELNVKAGIPSRRCTEVPIIFKDRVHGFSKLSGKVYRQYVEQLLSLYMYLYPGFVVTSAFAACKLAVIMWLSSAYMQLAMSGIH